MRALCLSVFLLAGCKHVSELQVQQHQEAASAATTETHEVKESGPEIIALTLDEYAQLCPGQAPTDPRPIVGGALIEQSAGGTSKQEGYRAVSRPADPSSAGSITQGPVLRHLEAVIYRGPSLDDLRQLSKVQTDLNSALAVHEEKKSGPVGLFAALLGLWPVILIGGAILAFTLLKPAWVGLAWRFVSGAAKAAFGKKVP